MRRRHDLHRPGPAVGLPVFVRRHLRGPLRRSVSTGVRSVSGRGL